jgi:outer membrane lipoprotein-sorting protein
MLVSLLLAATLAVEPADPLQTARAHYETVTSYKVVIESESRQDSQRIRYFYKKPGWVRMEFERPHKGATLIYDPAKNRVKLWPFGYRSFPGHSLSPGNSLIRSPNGQQVNKSDMGALFANIRALQEQGQTGPGELLNLDGKSCIQFEVAGGSGVAVQGVHRFLIWLDTANYLPYKVQSFDTQNELIETVHMKDLSLNVSFPEGFFAY